MLTIGFANKFYTLWDVIECPIYITDAYGNHHLARVDMQFNYIQNVAFDKADAIAKYPNAPIDEQLRGKTRSYESTGEDVRTTDIIWFGKYTGRLLSEIAEKDFLYILWLYGNSAKYKNAISALPQFVKHVNDMAAGKEAFQNECFTWTPGMEMEIYGTSNGRLFYEESDENVIYPCMFTATISCSEGNFDARINVKNYRVVNGMYPYIMPEINGKIRKTKNAALRIKPANVTSRVYGTPGNYSIEYIINM